ncbi:MAG: peptidyl-prolyl cis-trans isomerase [Elusimicrobiota bacterium]
MFPPLVALMLTLAGGAPAQPRAAANADREIIRVNGVAIRQSEVLERLWKRYGPQSVEEMIDELLLRQAAQAAKIKAAESDVDLRFSRLQAQFGSRELLLSQLEQAGTTVSKVREDLAEEIVRERLIMTAKGIKLSDDELKKSFEENKDKLGKPESVHLRHILVKSKEEAAELAAKIKGGADFQSLARAKSLAASGKATGGDYGFVSKGMLPAEIDEVAFSLKAGELRVLPGPRGHHILQVVDRRPAVPTSFAQSKDELREILLTEKIKAALPGYLQELRGKADIKTSAAASAAR